MKTGKKKVTEAPNDARESDELEDAVHKPTPCYPQTNRRRTHAEPAILNRCRPDEQDKSCSHHIVQP